LFSRLGNKLRRLHDTVSRSEWAARHLQKAPAETADHDVHAPGVLIIQIDGLGYDQLLRAMEKNRLPFLRRLIQRDHFVLRKFYSGLPSSTPAVQAELFFGVKSAVPAFKYYDRLMHREKTMFDADDVDTLAAKFEKKYHGLLRGGSSYSNIYAGGAKEALFCIQTMKLDSIFHDIQIRKIVWFFIMYFPKIARMMGLALLEVGLAVYDFVKGVVGGRNPLSEFKFIFSRIGACIVLRELVRLHVKIDIARGLPVIHANFIGYDEHSHRRGPSSAFALWTLKGIEGTVKDIMNKAMRSDKRDYHIFIFADHGQEPTEPFAVRTGRTLREAVQEVFSRGPLKHADYAEVESIIPYFRLHQRSRGLLWSTAKEKPSEPEEEIGNNTIHITAMGPLGHIYLPIRPDAEEMRHYAGSLVRDGGIPLVFYIENERVRCVSQAGDGDLGEKAPEIFGLNHPFLKEVTKDMEIICRHVHAGDFIISGWRAEGRSLTFPIEHGSHGGPGSQETKGFVILPDTVGGIDQPFLRPLDLRVHVRTILEDRFPALVPAVKKYDYAPQIIKVLTYNVHSCLGMDGKLFPARIARIISRHSPDIVALQEVDKNMERSRNQDQANLIAEQLDMQSIFFPLLQDRGGEYGLAILSRYPSNAMGFKILPKLKMKRPSENRGVMWLRLDTHCGPMHFFNTHLSYITSEKMAQMRHIVEGNMLDAIPSSEPVIFCGDLNSGSDSPTYKLLSEKLIDSQKVHPHSPPDPTFISSYPLLRLDYIFHSRHLAPVRVEVINDWECRLASDHLPVSSIFIYDPNIKR